MYEIISVNRCEITASGCVALLSDIEFNIIVISY